MTSWIIGIIGLYIAVTILGVIVGLYVRIFNNDPKRLINTWKIFKGNFYTDKNESWYRRLLHLVSRFTWELLQTTIGYLFSQLRNALGKVDRVDFIYGITYSSGENSKSRWGVSIGNHINISLRDLVATNFNARFFSDPLFVHEMGNTFDSKIFGPLYLFFIGIPSLISAIKSRKQSATLHSYTHQQFWTETRADRHAERFVSKKNRIKADVNHSYPI